MKHTRLRLAALVLMASIFMTVFFVKAKDATKIEDNDVVAVVAGTSILYNQVKATPEDTQLIFVVEQGRPPTDKDEDTIKRISDRLESQRLSKKIQEMVTSQLTQDFNITVSDAEVEVRHKKKGLDFVAAASGLRTRSQLMLSALSAVYDKQQDKQQVFRELLEGKTSSQEWDLWLRTYNSPEKRKFLERLAHASDKDFAQSLSLSTRREIINEKIFVHIDQLISEKDSSFASSLTLIQAHNEPQSKTSNEIEDAHDYVQSKRKQWWINYYNELVKIKVEAFAEILKQLSETAAENSSSFSSRLIPAPTNNSK